MKSSTNTDWWWHDFFDWFEIYNAGAEPIDLTGYFVTDDLQKPAKFRLQNTMIPANGFVVLWADDHDNWEHTNFKLNNDGEILALFSPDTVLIDYVHFGTILPDISYGRKPDGCSNWGYFGTPTPFQSNSTEACQNQDRANPPVFSLPNGFYSGNQQLVLSSGSQSAEIRFTLDGSIPTLTSTLYSKPLLIEGTSILRARAFESEKLPSEIITNTYFCNINTALDIISIVTPPVYLWDSLTGIYANSITDREIPCNIEYFDTSGISTFNQNIGLQICGQVASKLPQKSINIYARNKYGQNNINYKFFENRKNEHFQSIILRNGGFPENSSTMFREAMMENIVVGKIDLEYSEYHPVILYINGNYWGIYNLREKQDENYLAANEGVDPNNVDFLEAYWLDIIAGDRSHYESLLSYMAQCDINSETSMNYIKEQIDYDNFINYQITNIYYANTDWPGGNIRYWIPRTINGKWRWVLWDVEFGFGLESDYNHNTLEFATATNSQLWSNPPEATWFFRKMLENEEFKNIFIQRLAFYLNTVFEPDRIINIIDSFRVWGTPYCGISSMPYWENEIEIMREFARKRPSYMCKYIMEEYNIPDTVQLNIISSNGKIKLAGCQISSNNFTGKFFTGIPIGLEAIPDIGYQFAGWTGYVNSQSSQISIAINSDTFLVANFIPSSFYAIPSNIDSSLILSNINYPYFSTGDIIIDSNVTLTIEPGVEILMAENACFIVHGQLILDGESNNHIRIHANNISGISNWGAICVDNATNTTIIRHAQLEDCTYGHELPKFKAAVSGYNSNITLYNVSIKDADQPFFSQYGDYIKIKNCTLRSDAVCDLINIKYAGFALVQGCDLKGNDKIDTDGIDYDQINNGIIRNNTIYGFLAFNDDGIDIGESAQNLIIENNIIYNCFDKGISIGQASNANIKKNIFYNCHFGIGIKDSLSFAEIDRNTFYSNDYAIACFEKAQGDGGGHASVVNTIFSNCKSGNFFSDSLSDIRITYSLSDKWLLSGQGNIFTDPLFVDTAIYNFELQPGSPCIDAGDPASPLDEDNTRADIGAKFTFNPPDSAMSIIINEINYHSAPDADAGDWIEFYNNSNETINMSGWLFKDNCETHSYFFPQGLTLEPGELVVVVNDNNKFQYVYPNVYNYLSGLEFGFDNGGEPLRLFDGCMNLLDIVNYDDTLPWPETPDGFGSTLELIDPSYDNNKAESWRANLLLYGTPGTHNGLVNVENIEYSKSNNILIYPNPSQDLLNLYLKNQDYFNLKVNISDIYGRNVFSKNFTSNINQPIIINMTAYSAGIYILRADFDQSSEYIKILLEK
ncbi:MAG: CotH kinase family protein [Bacteroidia bacterium]|nr:CotH kinase family protein [Bacteroidia bacterium]